MEILDDPRATKNCPVLLQQYRGDIIRDCLKRFEEKNVTLKHLERWQKHRHIIYPWNVEYGTERLGYNRYNQVYPMMIVMAETIDDIRWALSKAIFFGIDYSIKSGGHDHTGLSLSDGIIICLSRRNHVIIYDDCVEVGTGIVFGQLDMKLSKLGSFTAVHGTCSNVSTNLIYGGGFGIFTRKYGLACDNAVEFDVLLANGDHVMCNENTHQDLFWALRGAGSCAFGVITDVKLKYHQIDEIVLYEFHYTLDQFHEVFKKWQKFAPYAANDLASKIVISSAKYPGSYPITLKGQFLGNARHLRKLLQWFETRAQESKIWKATVIEASVYHNESCAHPGWYFFYQSVLAVNSLNSNNLSTLYNFALNVDDKHCIVINALGGRFGEIKCDETAFPWRDSIMWIHIMSETKSQSDYNPMKMIVNETYNKLLDNGLRNPQTGVGRLYANFKDMDLKDTEYPYAYWGSNYSKLLQIKRKYDPDNLFRHRQGINL